MQEAIEYYQTCVEGLDVRFLAHVDAAVARAASAPRLARCFDGPFRKVHLERFPYAMIYREKGEGIEIMPTAAESQTTGKTARRPATCANKPLLFGRSLMHNALHWVGLFALRQ